MTAAQPTVDRGGEPVDPAVAHRCRVLIELVATYDGHVHRLLRDLADQLELSLAYVDRATVDAHLERDLTSAEWRSVAHRFRAMDFDDHIGDQGRLRTDWIETVLDAAGVPGRRGHRRRGDTGPEKAP